MANCRTNPLCELGNLCKIAQISGTRGTWYKEKNKYLQHLVDIMFVGYVPTWHDTNHGEAFTGYIRALMLDLFSKSSIIVEKCYFTNIVKCTPPSKRKPKKQEIIACRDHFHDELKKYTPQVIVPLGTEACSALGVKGHGGINKIRGTEFSYDMEGHKIPVIPIISPLSMLTRPSPRIIANIINDLQDIAVKVKHTYRAQNNPASVKYKVLDSKESIQNFIEEAKINRKIAFDTESPSFEWWKHPCMTIQLSLGKDRNFIFPFYKHDPDSTGQYKLKPTDAELCSSFLNEFKKLLSDPEFILIGHNIKYDLHVLANLYGWDNLYELKCHIDDTYIMAWNIDSHSLLDLEYLGTIDLGYPKYTEEVEKIVGVGKDKNKTYDNIPDDILWVYGATDAEITYRLYEQYIVWPSPSYYEKESIKLVKVLWEAERKGFPYDVELFDKMHKQEVGKTISKNEELQAIAAQVLPQNILPINFNSPQQVTKFLLALGYDEEIKDTAKSSGYTTNKEIITELAETDKRLAALSEYRKATKFVTSYLEDFPAMADEKGIHASYKIPGTTSGRLSARLIHQIARTDKKAVTRGEIVFRQLFKAKPGYTLVYGDFSQLELRMLAVASGDKGLIDLFAKDQDVHSRMTSKVLGVEGESGEIMAHSHKLATACDEHCCMVVVEVEPNRNDIGKRINFGLAYGSEGKKLVETATWKDFDGDEHPLTWMMLEEGMKRWAQEFPEAANFKETCVQNLKKNNGYANTQFGRNRYFSDLIKKRAITHKKLERELVNHHIQSPAASVLNRTLILIKEMKDELVNTGVLIDEDFYLVCTVHDSCAYMVRDEYVEWFKQVLKLTMERPIPELDNNVFKADIGIGKTWFEAEQKTK